jgi:predicted kinase
MAKLIIMQGIAGSGKSRVARRLVRPGRRVRPAIVSADLFPGLYAADGFHRELLGAAHKACFRAAVELVSGGENVVVDNTNLSALEMAPYVALGAAFGYEVEIVRVLCPQLVAYRRQTHGVPLAVHRGMARQLKRFQAPPYWDVSIREIG